MAKPAGLPVAASFEEIDEKDDLNEDVVAVEEWGCSVRVRGLSRGEIRAMGDDGVSAADAEALTLAAAMLEPKVTREQAEKLLEGKSYAATEKVLARILDLSGLGAGFRTEP